MTTGTRAIVIGMIANILLSLFKFVGGILGNSVALVADAIHSLSDLVTDLIVLFTHRIGKMPQDEDHPYGHGRAETIGATVIGLLIIVTGIGVTYKTWETINEISEQAPGLLAASAALLSILINEGLFHYTRRVGEATKSPALIANAWHHRSDAFSSIAALIGIIGAWQGFAFMDPLAGAVVGCMIVKVGIDITRQGVRDLMDTALSDEHTEKIHSILKEIPEVLHFHELRTRVIGGEFLIDVHILVDPEMTVTEGHRVAEIARRNLIKAIPNIQDVLIHVDGEPDAEVEAIYPITRKELIEIAQPLILELAGNISQPEIRVHHIKGKNLVDVFIKIDSNQTMEDSRALVINIKSKLETAPQIDQARIFLDLHPH
ncbi:MAG: cation transporter [Nitrospina sp.]|jgi:cation diffusion facilitator family transporter|nr:cation transporter [Nitrospina sp.]MBT3414042.1 cation transporter [Nitrospina sp.]MBT3858096.1 cation transporter [Nitrospina sp.]MBT4104535.1 cation transporter [Nitrospina sp.]MBT4389900.1 cation transporter [Nitrospina sp.]